MSEGTHHDRLLAWLGRMLVSPDPSVRMRAVGLLEHVECEERPEWLDRAGSLPGDDTRRESRCGRGIDVGQV